MGTDTVSPKMVWLQDVYCSPLYSYKVNVQMEFSPAPHIYSGVEHAREYILINCTCVCVFRYVIIKYILKSVLSNL